MNAVTVNALACHDNGAILRKLTIKVEPGSGKVKLNGVMDLNVSASAIAALATLTTCAIVSLEFLQNSNIAIDLPEKAIAGVSFGLPIFIGLYCAIKNIKPNKDIAYTGALDNSGNVLAVDGITLKLDAARAAKLKAVMLPRANFNEVNEIYPLYVHPLAHVSQAINLLLNI